jgi:hypothetical protein
MWNLGLLGAAGAPVAAGAFDLLQTTTLSSDEASFVFNNLVSSYSADYKHLQVRMLLRTNQSNNNLGNVRLEINGGTIGGRSHTLVSNGSTTTGTDEGSATYAFFTNATSKNQGSGSSFIYIPLVIDMVDVFQTNTYKTFKSFSGGVVDGQKAVSIGSSYFGSTDAINQLEFYVPSASWTSKSRFSLYGLRT